MPNENDVMARVQARADDLEAFGLRPDAGDIEEVAGALMWAEGGSQSDREIDVIANVALWAAERPEVIRALRTAAEAAVARRAVGS